MKLTHLLSVLAPFTLLAIVMGIAGCGGGGDTAVASITKIQFAKRADLVCESASSEQFQVAGHYLSQHPEIKEIKLVELAGIAPLEKEIRELRSMPLPEGHEREAKAFLRALPIALQELKKEPSRALPNQDNPFDQANKLGARLHLGDCSRNP